MMFNCDYKGATWLHVMIRERVKHSSVPRIIVKYRINRKWNMYVIIFLLSFRDMNNLYFISIYNSISFSLTYSLMITFPAQELMSPFIHRIELSMGKPIWTRIYFP